MKDPTDTRPLVFSCSGCSNVAQLSNHVAVAMDRAGFCRMSCVAGIGGDVEPLVRDARSGLPVLALDGCPLHCTRRTLVRAGISPDLHLTLTDFNIHPRHGQDFDLGTRHDMTLLVVQAVLDAGFPIPAPPERHAELAERPDPVT